MTNKPLSDTLTRGLLFDGCASVTAISCRRLVDRAISLHGLSPVAAAALGRTLTVTAVMARELKHPEDSLTVTLKGGGPLGSVVAAADGRLRLRGYLSVPDLDLPLNDLGKLDVGGAVGSEGCLTVVRDLGLKEPYVGQCRLVSGEIGEDFARYFSESEQQPSAVALGVLVDKPRQGAKAPCRCIAAGGFVIRPLPFCPEEVVAGIERKLAALTGVSERFRARTAEEFLREQFFDCGLEILDTARPVYCCTCSRRRVERTLFTLKEEDLRAFCREDGQVDVHCHFCGRHYPFTETDLDRIFAKRRQHG